MGYLLSELTHAEPTGRSFSASRVAPAGWGHIPGESPSLVGTLAALPASAAQARYRCAEFAESVGAPTATVEAVMLAVSEAITNVVQYAYPGRRAGMARVSARLNDAGDLKIAVADDGVGVTSAPSQGLGHGLAIIEKVSDELNVVSSPDSGTQVEMTFRLAAKHD